MASMLYCFDTLLSYVPRKHIELLKQCINACFKLQRQL